ncbi:MAG: tRNA glutamyl-Q(34) synthetase GluQRS [Pedosphaera sp.]|nr:tRNA glutamyl-Q(34) synthetase GluQRS [Pedosphaera sp.]
MIPAVQTPYSPFGYRGRLAPSPTGWLHLGHAGTFLRAWQRARVGGGQLILRNEDLDPARCHSEFVTGFLEDLGWLGLDWDEGPDIGGPYGPYSQSQRSSLYREAFERLRSGGFLYPCRCSRKDILDALHAPHEGTDEPVYPGTCRPERVAPDYRGSRPEVAWRFHVKDGQRVRFVDGGCGPQEFVAGVEFGDFVVWRSEGVPSYQLACVVDDVAMRITEVVRGRDLLSSTARQLLLYGALGEVAPAFFHCRLVTDEKGVRLAKRQDALSLRTLRERGRNPADIRRELDAIPAP